uniref:Sodium/calcium exchanger membrane region domain-containing protein n=1 Tax=Strigamia maritima TaxID=126957 RepID=T1JCX0_STRMM
MNTSNATGRQRQILFVSNKKRRFWKVLKLPIFFLCVFFAYSIFAKKAIEHSTQPVNIPATGGRHLLATSRLSCVPPSINDFPNDFLTQQQRLQGGIVFHFVISIFICYALAIVCDDYFVPSLGGISEAFNLPSDIAGATFMAAGTSAPELFTSVIGSFITEGDIGVGTIVGSAVFNILAVVAVCGLLAGTVIPLDWWPLTRDCLAYTVSVIAFEALGLIVLFVLYIVMMYFNERISNSLNAFADRFGKNKKQIDPRENEKEPLLSRTNRVRTYSTHSTTYSDPEKQDAEKQQNDLLEAPTDKVNDVSIRDMLEGSNDEEDGSIFSMPFRGSCKQIGWVLIWPIALVFYATIPDCRTERWKNWYIATFFISITYIGALSYLVSWMVTVIGYTFGIPDTVMGLTFLAAGTSVPEAISSVIVCRQGFGNMAISNSVGSNVFDILFCLGLPWFIKAAMSPLKDYSVAINSKGLEYSVIALLTTVVFMFATVAANGFKLNKTVGCTCLLIYAGFLVISSLFELNVFGDVNLPTCIE